jgi:cell filamentation protein
VTIDPYLDPAAGVLRNRLDISDGATLRVVEADITAAIMLRLSEQTLPGAYDLTHLSSFHREIFGDLYPWAGEIRTVAIAKTDLFCLPQHIEPYAAEVFGQLADEKQLRDLPRERFVSRLTHFYAEVNALHPFREGNGRTQRAFFSQLARAAGWPIDWTTLDAERNTETSIASLRGDNRPLLAMFDGLVAP